MENAKMAANIEERYVGFCDILGFSNRLLADFEGTLQLYKQFGSEIEMSSTGKVELSVYSDAVLVTGDSLPPVLTTIQGLWFFALQNDFMIRGAVTKGRYWEQRQEGRMLVASDALVRAVKLEKDVGVPAVVVADDVEIPDEIWLHRFQVGLLLTPLLHFRDRNIVNPFNPMWYRSASTRATRLMETSPAHRDKFLWFLALHRTVGENAELVPPSVVARFLRDGILRRMPLESQPA
jgi:hypothetical protein